MKALVKQQLKETDIKTYYRVVLTLLLLPVSACAWQMESGTITLSNTTGGIVTTVTLKQKYSTPPLIFAIATQQGAEPASLRIVEKNTTAFSITQVEPQGNDGPHAAMTVHYLAIDQGEHLLPDGTKITAGIHQTNSSIGRNDGVADVWDLVTFPTAFGTQPIVLAMIQTHTNEPIIDPSLPSSPWMTVGIRGVTATKLDLTLERAETSTGTVSSNETVAYLAIEPSITGVFLDVNDVNVSYETILTPDTVVGWNNGCNVYNFQNTYSAAPNVIAAQNTRDGADGGWLRRCSLSTSNVGLTVDEDVAADLERSHTTEIAGIFVFSNDFAFNTTYCGHPLPLEEYEWLMLSRPCGTESNPTIEEIFANTLSIGDYGDDSKWIVWKFDGTNPLPSQSDRYVMVTDPSTEVMEFGVGYWFISDTNVTWDNDLDINETWYQQTTGAVLPGTLGITNINVAKFRVVDPVADSGINYIRDKQTILLGNPFPKEMKLANIYVSDDNGSTYFDMGSTGANISKRAYIHDIDADEAQPYVAVTLSTPGTIQSIPEKHGFWIQLFGGSNQHQNIRLALPLEK